ncbi:MAG: hypothetical protein V4507_05965, partial [Verrucomicrobiota bacterium]
MNDCSKHGIAWNPISFKKAVVPVFQSFFTSFFVRGRIALLLIFFLEAVFGFSQTASLPYSTGFETTDGYNGGAFPLTGKPWAPSGAISITTSGSQSGTQALSIAPSGIYSSRIQLNLNTTTTTNQVVYADFYLQGIVGNVADLNAMTKSANAVVMALVQTGTDAELYVAHGMGDGNLTWVGTGRKWPITGKTMTNYQRVTARIDLLTYDWDLYLDGTLAVMDIGFVTNKQVLKFVNFRGDAAGTTKLDSFNLTTTNPLFTDVDHDGMDDSWEIANGLNPMVNDRNGDLDGDGLTNVQEYVYKTKANVVDSDGDGVNDGVEVQNATNPNSELTVTETFESNKYVLNSLLAGQGKWTGTGTGSATIQGSVVKEGTQAVKVTGSTYALKRAFMTTEKGVWTDFYLKPVKKEGTTTPTLDATSSIGAYFDTDGNLRLYDGTTSSWKVVTTNGVDTTQWQRLTFYQDYNTKKWSAWLNSIQVATNLGFKNLTTLNLGSFSITSGKGDTYVDKLTVGVTQPTGLDQDTDGDGLPDSWEMTNFGNLSQTASGDFDGDGKTNLQEYQGGSNPSDYYNGALP